MITRTKLSETAIDEIAYCIERGSKLTAIKTLRQHIKISLLDAKELIEAYDCPANYSSNNGSLTVIRSAEDERLAYKSANRFRADMARYEFVTHTFEEIMDDVIREFGHVRALQYIANQMEV